MRRRDAISISFWTSEEFTQVMTDRRGVLFVPYKDTLGLLSVDDVLAVCGRVYLMHATWPTAFTTTGT
jgi:hypothetical protein